MDSIKRIERNIDIFELCNNKNGSGWLIKKYLIDMLDEVGIKDSQQITISTTHDNGKIITIDWMEQVNEEK